MLSRIVQEKYGGTEHSRFDNEYKRARRESASSDESTDSEEEDEAGILVSAALDAQIQETLQAIRQGDPRVYDQDAKFFNPEDDNDVAPQPNQTKPKPIYLADYHRQELLDKAKSNDIDTQQEAITYVQQQDELKADILRDIHGLTSNPDKDLPHDDEEEGGFLTAKPVSIESFTATEIPKVELGANEVEKANENPEEFLSKYMSTRAWVSNNDTRFQPFESDDEEDDQRAEEFEEAYNSRFDESSKLNEKLVSHARDIVAKHSVRKEKPNSRQKSRELERERRAIEKQTRKEEKARFRKLKVAQVDERLQKIKEAAGFDSQKISDEDWITFLDEDWNDERWEQEMKNRFGEQYYSTELTNEKDAVDGGNRLRKPKWEDDIDIDDIVSAADRSEGPEQLPSSHDDLSDDGGVRLPGHGKLASKQSTNVSQESRKRDAKKERRRIERIVDNQMEVDEVLAKFGRRHTGNFRYRETSPLAFGLTAQDILLASDSQLNQYAGLKKMAAFRDPEKKRKDKKRLGKKARIKQWRKETFGDEKGPKQTFPQLGLEQQKHDISPSSAHVEGATRNVREGKRRKRRPHSKKTKT